MMMQPHQPVRRKASIQKLSPTILKKDHDSEKERSVLLLLQSKDDGYNDNYDDNYCYNEQKNSGVSGVEREEQIRKNKEKQISRNRLDHHHHSNQRPMKATQSMPPRRSTTPPARTTTSVTRHDLDQNQEEGDGIPRNDEGMKNKDVGKCETIDALRAGQELYASFRKRASIMSRPSPMSTSTYFVNNSYNSPPTATINSIQQLHGVDNEKSINDGEEQSIQPNPQQWQQSTTNSHPLVLPPRQWRSEVVREPYDDGRGKHHRRLHHYRHHSTIPSSPSATCSTKIDADGDGIPNLRDLLEEAGLLQCLTEYSQHDPNGQTKPSRPRSTIKTYGSVKEQFIMSSNDNVVDKTLKCTLADVLTMDNTTNNTYDETNMRENTIYYDDVPSVAEGLDDTSDQYRPNEYHCHYQEPVFHHHDDSDGESDESSRVRQHDLALACHNAATPAMHNRKTVLTGPVATPSAERESKLSSDKSLVSSSVKLLIPPMPSSTSLQLQHEQYYTSTSRASSMTTSSSSSSCDWRKNMQEGASALDDGSFAIVPVDNCIQLEPGIPMPIPNHPRCIDTVTMGVMMRGGFNDHDVAQDVSSVAGMERTFNPPQSIRRIGVNHEVGSKNSASTRKEVSEPEDSGVLGPKESSKDNDDVNDTIQGSGLVVPTTIQRLDSVQTYQTLVSEITMPSSIHHLNLDPRAPQYRMAQEHHEPLKKEQVHHQTEGRQTLSLEEQQQLQQHSHDELGLSAGGDLTTRTDKQKISSSSDETTASTSSSTLRKYGSENHTYTQHLMATQPQRRDTLLGRREAGSIGDNASPALYAIPPTRPPPSPSSGIPPQAMLCRRDTAQLSPTTTMPKQGPYMDVSALLVIAATPLAMTQPRPSFPSSIAPSTPTRPRQQLSALTNPYYGDGYPFRTSPNDSVTSLLGSHVYSTSHEENNEDNDDNDSKDEWMISHNDPVATRSSGKNHTDNSAIFRDDATTTERESYRDVRKEDDPLHRKTQSTIESGPDIVMCTVADATYSSLSSHTPVDHAGDDESAPLPPLTNRYVARRGTIGGESASAKPPNPKAPKSPVPPESLLPRQDPTEKQQKLQFHSHYMTPTIARRPNVSVQDMPDEESSPTYVLPDRSTGPTSSASESSLAVTEDAAIDRDDEEKGQQQLTGKLDAVLGPFISPESAPRRFCPVPGTPLQDSNPLLYPSGLSFKSTPAFVGQSQESEAVGARQTTIKKNELIDMSFEEIDLSTHESLRCSSQSKNKEIDLSDHDPDLHDIDLSQHSPNLIFEGENEEVDLELVAAISNGDDKRNGCQRSVRTGYDNRKGNRNSASKAAETVMKSPSKTQYSKMAATDSSVKRSLPQALPFNNVVDSVSASDDGGSGPPETGIALANIGCDETSFAAITAKCRTSGQKSQCTPSSDRALSQNDDESGGFFDLVIEERSDVVEPSEIGMESTIYTEEYESESESEAYEEEELTNYEESQHTHDESEYVLEEIVEEEDVSVESSSRSSHSVQEEGCIDMYEVKEEYALMKDHDMVPTLLPMRAMSNPVPPTPQLERPPQPPIPSGKILASTFNRPTLNCTASVASTTSTVQSGRVFRVKMAPMEVVYVCEGEEVTFTGFYSGPINPQGQMHGSGVFWFNTGDLYLGQFDTGNLHGCGALSIMVEEEWDQETGEVLVWSKQILKGYFCWNQYLGPDPLEDR